MKLKVKEQIICCIMVVILFFTGMCVELPSADASFLYAKKATVSSAADSVISNRGNTTKLEPICVIEAFSHDAIISFRSNRGRTLIRRFFRNVVALVAVAILLSHLFQYGDVADLVSSRKIGSHAVIVKYIQQKDGKK